jgi:NhaP-type Na+/H+ or K+/H+ antiporter
MTSGRSSIFGGSDRYGGGVSGSSSRRIKSRNGMIRGFVLLLICIILFLCLVGPNGILDLVTDHHLDKVHPKNYKKHTNNAQPADTNTNTNTNNAKKALDLLSQEEEEEDNMEEQENVNHNKDDRSNDEPTSVADALQCRASVVAFVINSTDKNDECEGLRKAFDQTCSDATTNSHSQSTTQHHHPNRQQRQQQHVRRNLSLLDATVEQHYTKKRQRRSSHDLTPLMKTIESIPMEEMDENSRPIRSADNEDENDEEEPAVLSRRQSGDDTNNNNNNNNNEVPVKKQLSPSLPTSSKHIDQATLQDAVILQKETTTENIVEAVMAATNQTTNHEGQDSVSMTQAKKEASDSSKAVSTATAVVSAVLNDPETVEATKCCASIIDVYHEYCDNPGDQEISDRRLFVIVFVIAICGMVKSLIRHFQVRWLPEAAGCILVGVVGGVGIKFIPHFEFGFQHDLFLRLMVPPIVFEAALNIDKRAFARHFVPIFVYAVYGTLLSTLLTAFFVYKGTYMLSYWCTQIPFIESLTFGALISSIDPIAVLSVLSNIGMSDKDTIYVLIFGESLLNDGVAIVLFQTLMHFLDDSLIIDSEAIAQASIHFCVIAFGSLFIGFLSGSCATIYFWSMKGMQTPLVEVLMFLCWAFIPYYICDGVDWSGIVAIVAAGFVMDIFIIGNKRTGDDDGIGSPRGTSRGESTLFCGRCYRSFLRNIFSKDGFLSSKAKSHIGFVTEINATFMETSIFAYLGLFLFSSRYRWSFSISIIAIGSCVFSRGFMIVICSFCANVLSRIRCFTTRTKKDSTTNHHNHHHNDIIIDSRTQIVLLFAGLRGAMSFALVETIPMYDAVSGTGTSVKPELKAMTSASILFTVFVLGGYTSYLLEKLGFQAKNEDDAEMVELTSSLVSRSETNNNNNNNHHQFRQRYIKSNFSK